MNYLIILVALVVIFIMIFAAFASDDREEEIGYLEGEDDSGKSKKEIQENKEELLKNENSEGEGIEQEEQITEEFSDDSSLFQQVSDAEEQEVMEQPVNKPAEVTKIRSIRPQQEIVLKEAGSEDDLRLRLNLKHNIAGPVSFEKIKCVTAVIQLRFPDDVIKHSPDFCNVLRHAEKVFENEFAFEFTTYQGSQFNRIWIFESSEDRNAIVESLIVAYEATVRFRQTIETDAVLRDNKVRISIGLSAGEMVFVNRGVNTEPTMFGKPVYIAETLAEVVGDFGIYVDSSIHDSTLPLFVFRELKPTVVRPTLPPISLFELAGWNKPYEISAFIKHDEASVRRAVAVAFRYFEIEDMHPLIELMSDKEREVVLEAVSTIGFIGSDKMNGALKLKLPEITDPEVKSKVIEAFGNAGNDSVLPLVRASTKENSWKVRLAATQAVYKLGGADSLANLQAMLNDPDSIVRVAANSIFYKETKQPEYFEALVDFLSDASKRARATAVDCLMEIGSDRALKEITNVFANQELDLQKHILVKMLGSKSKILYQCFLTMFKNSNEVLRPYIVEAVRRAGIMS